MKKKDIQWNGVMMEIKDIRNKDDIGYILWKLESCEKFYPSFQTLIEPKQTDESNPTPYTTKKI